MAVIHVTEANFEQEVLNSTVPVLVDFWASWCVPCQRFSPIIDEIADEVTDIKVCKLNTDEADIIAARYNVMSIPTLKLFKNGSPVATSVGEKSKAAVMDFIKS